MLSILTINPDTPMTYCIYWTMQLKYFRNQRILNLAASWLVAALPLNSRKTTYDAIIQLQ